MDKVIGLDLGTNTIGIAVSDVLGIAHPKETFRFDRRKYDLAASHVIALTNELNIKEIAIGLPLRLNGSISDMSEDVTNFVKMLTELDSSLKIEYVDERLTTVSAHKSISELGLNHEKRKAVVDQVSAVEILDTYLRKKEFANGGN